MTGIAILLGGLAVMLLWAGITGKSAIDQFQAVITGKKSI